MSLFTRFCMDYEDTNRLMLMFGYWWRSLGKRLAERLARNAQGRLAPGAVITLFGVV